MENEKQIEIRKIMEKESAIKILSEIKEKIGGVDLSSICDEASDIIDENSQDPTINRLIQAIQCGLVYWDEGENILVQKLIYPITCGQTKADHFKYIKKLTINELEGLNTKDQLKVFKNILAQITARPVQLIGQLRGQDTEIAMGCLSFFDK